MKANTERQTGGVSEFYKLFYASHKYALYTLHISPVTPLLERLIPPFVFRWAGKNNPQMPWPDALS